MAAVGSATLIDLLSRVRAGTGRVEERAEDQVEAHPASLYGLSVQLLGSRYGRDLHRREATMRPLLASIAAVSLLASTCLTAVAAQDKLTPQQEKMKACKRPGG